MNPFKKILLCVHPEITDANVVDHAARIARKFNATVRVMHTIADYPEDISEWWNVQNPDALQSRIIEERQAYLDDIVGYLRDLGAQENDTRIRWGSPAMEIIQEVLENEHDLVIITASHKSRFTKKMLDCPSLELMRQCPSTVWVAQGKITKSYKRIAVALGDRKGDITCDGMNERAVKAAVLLATGEGSELHVIHALPVYGGKKKPTITTALSQTLAEKHQLINDSCRFLFQEAGMELSDDRIHVPAGSPPALQIKKVVKALKIDLVVMGTTMDTGYTGLILGSTCGKFFTHTKTTVVSVKPPDFQCQIVKRSAA